MKIKTFYFNPFRECTYLLSNEAGEALLIDSGNMSESENSRLSEYLTQNGLKLIALLLTHGHADHCLGVKYVYDETGIIPTLTQADVPHYLKASEQAQMFGLSGINNIVESYQLIEDTATHEGEKVMLHIGNFPAIEVISTPGHTPGSVCYYIEEEHVLFSGDTLFQGGVGRTDLPGGDYIALIHSLQKLVTKLSEQKCHTDILPGHGYPTTLDEELSSNPYL